MSVLVERPASNEAPSRLGGAVHKHWQKLFLDWEGWNWISGDAMCVPVFEVMFHLNPFHAAIQMMQKPSEIVGDLIRSVEHKKVGGVKHFNHAS